METRRHLYPRTPRPRRPGCRVPCAGRPGTARVCGSGEQSPREGERRHPRRGEPSLQRRFSNLRLQKRDLSCVKSVSSLKTAKHQAALAVICQPYNSSIDKAAATGFDKCAVLAFFWKQGRKKKERERHEVPFTLPEQSVGFYFSL